MPILLKATSPEGETKRLLLSVKPLKNWDLVNVELVKHFMKKEIELVNMN